MTRKSQELANAYGIDLDDVAEWLGLHYGRDLRSESVPKKLAWIHRYAELHGMVPVTSEPSDPLVRAMQLRKQAQELLLRAQELDRLDPFVVMHADGKQASLVWSVRSQLEDHPRGTRVELDQLCATIAQDPAGITPAEGVNEGAPNPAAAWLHAVKPGATVWWNDPDHDVSSGYYNVVAILEEDGRVQFEDTMLFVRNEAGSEAEVLAMELSPKQPEDVHAVVQVVVGDKEILGYARTAESAQEIFDRFATHEVQDVVLVDSLELRNGTLLTKAWMDVESA